MNRIILLSLGILTTFQSFAFAGDTFREPSDFISKEGQLRITDGSSIYTFKKDGTFELHPVGVSGREIKGTWKSRNDNNRFIEIEGEWMWMNGEVIPNDFRKMVLAIYPLSGEKEKVGISNTEVYKCYFVIDEISKITAAPAISGIVTPSRSIESFRFIGPTTTMQQVKAKLGEPDRDVGSGIYIYEYLLTDGTRVWIGSSDNSRILYVRHGITSINDGEVLYPHQYLFTPTLQNQHTPISPPP
jgi:hypothetical protein